MDMLRNENVEKYLKEIEKIIKEAKKNGINIQPYEKKIEKSGLVIERGIAIFACDVEVDYVPTWKLTE